MPATVHARAALAGNPSDGYGGRTVAFCFANYAAHVEARPGRGCVPPDPDVARLFDAVHVRAGTAELTWSTTIPRQVGLAGSSALVIAALRALGHTEDLARTALAIEVEDLGIAAGLQDRVVQSRGGLVAMDFTTDAHVQLDPAGLPPLYVAHQPGDGTPSGLAHGDLRRRFTAGEPAVAAGLRELAACASRAAAAITAGDHPGLAAAIDATFDARRALMPLDPALVAKVEAARGVGASANFAGSGGAIVGTQPPGGLDALRRALDPWVVLEPTIDL